MWPVGVLPAYPEREFLVEVVNLWDKGFIKEPEFILGGLN